MLLGFWNCGRNPASTYKKLHNSSSRKLVSKRKRNLDCSSFKSLEPPFFFGSVPDLMWNLTEWNRFSHGTEPSLPWNRHNGINSTAELSSRSRTGFAAISNPTLHQGSLCKTSEEVRYQNARAQSFDRSNFYGYFLRQICLGKYERENATARS